MEINKNMKRWGAALFIFIILIIIFSSIMSLGSSVKHHQDAMIRMKESGKADTDQLLQKMNKDKLKFQDILNNIQRKPVTESTNYLGSGPFFQRRPNFHQIIHGRPDLGSGPFFQTRRNFHQIIHGRPDFESGDFGNRFWNPTTSTTNKPKINTNGSDCVTVENRCFSIYYDLKTSWIDAKVACINSGGYMPEFFDENFNLLKIYDSFPQIVNKDKVWVWLNARDNVNEHIWKWGSGQTLSEDDIRWGSGEPNNIQNEDCLNLHFKRINGNRFSNFNDDDCGDDMKTSTICEYT